MFGRRVESALLRVWAEFVRGLSRGIRVLDSTRICKGVVFALFALFAWFACAGDLQGTLEALILGLHKFCKICAKMARFCATICADRFRSCYLKAVPDCAKDLRLGSVCQCSAPMFEAVLRLWAC